VPLAPAIIAAIEDRAGDAWYGYETRPDDFKEIFWSWMTRRHDWSGQDLTTLLSPSVGTSIGSLIEIHTEPGDGVILQPPVFTDFKPLINRSGREPVRNSLRLSEDRYSMDLDDLTTRARDPATKLMILCNPHNPVGRVWEREELSAVAAICGQNDVFVVADEIHADLALPPHRFTPFAVASRGSGVRWAATHGPIKTFGLAGVADTYLVTDDETIAEQYQSMSGRLHLNRNNVFSLSATKAGYSQGDDWLDEFLVLIARNVQSLETGLPEEVGLVRHGATYLAWLDFRQLGLDVPELSSWLVDEARLALSPGHWFGREGAGFARMTIAIREEVLDEAITRLRLAVERGRWRQQ
jgi:cystathionine beta-lyase